MRPERFGSPLATKTKSPSVETIVSAEQPERRSFGQQLRCRAWRKQFVGINRINWLAFVERVKLNPEERVLELRPIYDGLNALLQSLWLRD